LALARQAPDLAARTDRLSREIDLMAENGLRFDEATAQAIGKAEARHTRSGRVALWVIALTLIYIAWKLP
ncbi:ubiquinone biosynthesis protein UbiB, partial [Mesorhizobium sp. M2A.F.Ca.ET.029.05.1.1]